MADFSGEIIFKKAVSPAEGGYPGLNPRTRRTDGMIIEYDVAVPMRDGIKIYIDVFRPDTPGEYPPIIAWGPYGKHGRVSYDAIGNTGINDGDFNEFTRFEAADPVYWCRNGYVIIYADMRGTWGSEGDATFHSPQEVEDVCDLIEWAGTQPWSNGKVGMHGVSYLSETQWKAAAANPPHLAAMNIWEGVNDYYRELFFHGGIPDSLFSFMWQASVQFSRTRVEDFVSMKKLHPLFDEYWASKKADLTKITIPAFIVASWTDHGLHNRGTLEGFKQIASEHKWLLVHGRKKWWHEYQPENIEKQRQFFNRFLKGIEIDNHVMEWPRVTLEIREKYYVGELRTESEWPIARTKYTPYYLDTAEGTLAKALPTKEGAVRYDADRVYYQGADPSRFSRFYVQAVNDILAGAENAKTGTAAPSAEQKATKATFQVKFTGRTELTGYMKLKLWVEADGSDDLDLFVALDKIDQAGYRVPFPYFGNHDDGPVALGWLRASHRELDEAKSTPQQPWHTHARELKLKPGEIVPVDIEIWPTSIVFEAGESLRLTVQGSDVYWYPTEGHTLGHLETVNKGTHVIHTGAKYDSHLLAAVVPSRGLE